jgi:uncharacterized protein
MPRMNARQALPFPLPTVLLRIGSSIFMTFACYGHCKSLATPPWYWAALCLAGALYFIIRSA